MDTKKYYGVSYIYTTFADATSYVSRQVPFGTDAKNLSYFPMRVGVHPNAYQNTKRSEGQSVLCYDTSGRPVIVPVVPITNNGLLDLTNDQRAVVTACQTLDYAKPNTIIDWGSRYFVTLADYGVGTCALVLYGYNQCLKYFPESLIGGGPLEFTKSGCLSVLNTFTINNGISWSGLPDLVMPPDMNIPYPTVNCAVGIGTVEYHQGWAQDHDIVPFADNPSEITEAPQFLETSDSEVSIDTLDENYSNPSEFIIKSEDIIDYFPPTITAYYENASQTVITPVYPPFKSYFFPGILDDWPTSLIPDPPSPTDYFNAAMPQSYIEDKVYTIDKVQFKEIATPISVGASSGIPNFIGTAVFTAIYKSSLYNHHMTRTRGNTDLDPIGSRIWMWNNAGGGATRDLEVVMTDDTWGVGSGRPLVVTNVQVWPAGLDPVNITAVLTDPTTIKLTTIRGSVHGGDYIVITVSNGEYDEFGNRVTVTVYITCWYSWPVTGVLPPDDLIMMPPPTPTTLWGYYLPYFRYLHVDFSVRVRITGGTLEIMTNDSEPMFGVPQFSSQASRGGSSMVGLHSADYVYCLSHFAWPPSFAGGRPYRFWTEVDPDQLTDPPTHRRSEHYQLHGIPGDEEHYPDNVYPAGYYYAHDHAGTELTHCSYQDLPAGITVEMMNINMYAFIFWQTEITGYMLSIISTLDGPVLLLLKTVDGGVNFKAKSRTIPVSEWPWPQTSEAIFGFIPLLDSVGMPFNDDVYLSGNDDEVFVINAASLVNSTSVAYLLAKDANGVYNIEEMPLKPGDTNFNPDFPLPLGDTTSKAMCRASAVSKAPQYAP